MNTRIEGRTTEEYEKTRRIYINDRYKDTRKEKQKEHYEANKDKLKETWKDYYVTNKDVINEKRKNRYEKQKENLFVYIVCDCGCSIRQDNKTNHEKTKKHMKLMEKLNSQQDTE